MRLNRLTVLAPPRRMPLGLAFWHRPGPGPSPPRLRTGTSARRNFVLAAWLFLSLTSLSLAVDWPSRVIVVVWDGMRPDFVSEQTTPNLTKLARHGVIFEHHHPVYVSSTEVNGAALATGVYPEKNGVIGNSEFRPQIEPLVKINTAALAAVRKGDAETRGHFLLAPTMAEMLHSHGIATAVAGAKTVTLLQDRFAGTDNRLGVDIFEGTVLPSGLKAELTNTLGQFPPSALPKKERDAWTTSAMIGPLWAGEVPRFSLLWLSEPDYSQHMTGPGSRTSLAAIKSSDENLGRVLHALEQKHLRRQTDIIVVSDHAFSTIAQPVDVAALLKTNGFRAFREFPSENPLSGDVLVVGNGGSVFFYVTEHDTGVVGRLAHWIMAQPFSGVLFSRQPMSGAFTLDQAKINSPEAPDLAMAFRWTAGTNTNGTPGLIYSDRSEYGSGQGMHASLSPFDMHNTCIAAGPHFRKGFRDPLPSGNVDIAPTVLKILDITPTQPLSGRVLTEALRTSRSPLPAAQSRRIEAVYEGDGFVWRQYLRISQLAGTLYLDEGNGAQTPGPSVPSK